MIPTECAFGQNYSIMIPTERAFGQNYSICYFQMVWQCITPSRILQMQKASVVGVLHIQELSDSHEWFGSVFPQQNAGTEWYL